jgi:hypothetical protein
LWNAPRSDKQIGRIAAEFASRRRKDSAGLGTEANAPI